MTTISTQQVVTQAMVSAMAVSIMASAMGVTMGAIGAEAFKVPPAELKGTQAAVRDLKLAFGGKTVDQAVKNVGVESALALAKEVERLVIEDMTQQYGEWATKQALRSAAPGDVQSAREIAAALARRGYGKFIPPHIAASETPPPMAVGAMEVAKKRVKQKAKPVLDTRTGVQYRSKAAAGMAVAAEYGLDSTNTFIWYEVIKKDPDRFKEIGVLSPAKPVSPATAYKPPGGAHE